MLRIILLSLSFLALSCSKHQPPPVAPQPPPVAPAGKATDDDCALCDFLGGFNDQQEEEAETDSTSSEGGPDLIVQSPSVNDSILTPGQALTLQVTVHNQGDEQAAATTLHYYRSNNSTITASDTEVGTDAIDALDASATSAASIALTAPTGGAPGVYYGACVASVSGESNTDNNCSSAVRITVSGQETPDDTSQVAVEDDTLSEDDTQQEIETDVDFNIEIVFLNDFDPDKKAWIKEIASQWEMFFYDMDDYVFDNAIELPIHPGLNVRFEKGEVIDDIRIYIDRYNEETIGNFIPTWSQPNGVASVVLFRPDGDVPVIARMLINEEEINREVREQLDGKQRFYEVLWRGTFHHEMGHAFGIGPSPAWTRNVYWQDNFNAWFIGENALREYRIMDPDDNSIGIPLGENSLRQPRTAAHWELLTAMKWDFFTFYWLRDNELPNISKTTLGAFHDIGWKVKYETGYGIEEDLPHHHDYEKGLPICQIPGNFYLQGPNCP